MKVIIPPDLARYLRRKLLIRLGTFLLLSAVLVTLLILRPGFIGDFDETNYALFAIIGAILILLVSGVPFKVIDRSWEGVVQNVRVKTTTETETPGKGTIESLYTQNIVILTIKTPKGRTLKWEAEKMRASDGQALINKYKKGDYVAHIAFTKHLAHFKPHPDSTRCVVCGMENTTEHKTCAKCGMGLVLQAGNDPADAETK